MFCTFIVICPSVMFFISIEKIMHKLELSQLTR